MQNFFHNFTRKVLKNRKTVFEIAYLLAWNFQNNFNPNDRQIFRKMLISRKRDIIFFWVNFSTETKSALKIDKI
jgi:hypothetical protein